MMGVIRWLMKNVGNLKTTGLGIVGVVSSAGTFLTVTAATATAFLDGDPLTVPDWSSVLAAWGVMTGGLALIFYARDSKKEPS